MANPPENPSDLGDVTAEWIGFALNVGLKLAETVGTGLRLFNALRARFEGTPGDIVGEIASTIGQAIRAATGLSSADYNAQIGSMELPTVPASWNQGEPGDRILAGVDVSGTITGQDAPEVRRVWINGLESDTPADFIEQAEALYERLLNATKLAEQQAIEQEISNLFFLARRY